MTSKVVRKWAKHLFCLLSLLSFRMLSCRWHRHSKSLTMNFYKSLVIQEDRKLNIPKPFTTVKCSKVKAVCASQGSFSKKRQAPVTSHLMMTWIAKYIADFLSAHLLINRTVKITSWLALDKRSWLRRWMMILSKTSRKACHRAKYSGTQRPARPLTTKKVASTSSKNSLLLTWRMAKWSWGWLISWLAINSRVSKQSLSSRKRAGQSYTCLW